MVDELFADTIRQTQNLRDLVVERSDQPAGAERALAEIAFRLGRAQYGYRRALESMGELAEALSGHANRVVEEGGASFVASRLALSAELFDQIPFYVEGCYAQLWRIVERCSSRQRPWAALFLELKGFNPEGVRDARNERFEHVDHNQLAAWGWSDGGPRLYPELILKGGAIDEGLVPNVEEYLHALRDRLAQLDARLTDGHPGIDVT